MGFLQFIYLTRADDTSGLDPRLPLDELIKVENLQLFCPTRATCASEDLADELLIKTYWLKKSIHMWIHELIKDNATLETSLENLTLVLVSTVIVDSQKRYYISRSRAILATSDTSHGSDHAGQTTRLAIHSPVILET